MTEQEIAKVKPAQDQSVALQNGSDSTQLIELIRQASKDPGIDVEKMERLVGLYERMEARKAERAFNEAMTAAQAEIKRVAADADNPQTRSKYASYAALDKMLRPIMVKHGLSVSFDTEPGLENAVRIVGKVSHVGGHCRDYRVDIPADGKGAKGGDVMTKTHAVGSALTYGKRYLLMLIFPLPVGGPEDDDGNAAAGLADIINDSEYATIMDLIEQSGTDETKFCAYMKIQSVRGLLKRRYRDAIVALNTKLHRSEQKGQRT